MSDEDIEAIRKAIRSGSARGLQECSQVIERGLIREFGQELEQVVTVYWLS